MNAQPKIEGPWSKSIEDRGLVRQPRATLLMRSAIGHLRFDLPSQLGIPINIVDSATKRYRMKVKWAGGDQLGGRRFPIPANPKLTDPNSKDYNLICWDPESGELFESIAYQPSLGTGVVSTLLGRRDHKAAKAAYWNENEPFVKLDDSEQAACVAGQPIAPQLLHPAQLDHRIAICVPPQFVGSAMLGWTDGASDADGFVNYATEPHVLVGQTMRLTDIDMTGFGSLARKIVHTMQNEGVGLIMSGNPNTTFLKFVVQKGAFSPTDKASLKGLETITGQHLECWGEAA